MNERRITKLTHRIQAGFTLVELVTVIVILSIVAAIGGGFIVNSAESYRASTAHAQLTQQARQALERASRELRHALPNSIRIAGDCIEWLPVVGAGRYQDQLAGRVIGTLETTPILVSLHDAYYLSIAALSPDELYSSNPKALRYLQPIVPQGSTVTSLSVTPSTDIFVRDSVAQRAFLLGQPKQLCMHAGRFSLQENYSGSFLAATPIGVPPSAGVLLTHIADSGNAGFELDNSSEARNSIVTMTLPLAQAGKEIVLEHKVMLRNVP